jgi:predicted nucleotidyltransferase
MTAANMVSFVPIGSKRRVFDELPVVVAKIVSQLRPEKIILFGSYAYGTPTPDSDVDLLIIMDTQAPRKERSWAVSRLLIPRPFPVDIVVKTPREIDHALAGRDFFLQEILDRGKVLYERSQ